jgi:hypothetical protein
MRVKESDLGEVMLSVFNELNLPERGRISLQTIEQNWAHTGLRQNDVATALRVLEDNGHLSQSERAYELTPAGFAAMVKTSSARSFLLGSAQRLQRQARRRLTDPANRPSEVDRRH